MKLVGAAAIAAAVASLVGANAALAKPGKNWQLEVSAGVKYDGRVTADESDVSDGSDAAAVFGVDAAYRPVDTDTGRIEIGYEFDQSLYQDLSAFDYQRHNPTLSGWLKLSDGLKLALGYSYAHSTLGGNRYLDQHRLSPSFSTYMTEAVQITAFYRYYDKNFAENARDATAHEPGLDLHYFFGKTKKSYFVIGASYTSEDTTGPAFDYKGPSAHAAIQCPFELFGADGLVKFSYTYQLRDYDNAASLTPPVPGDTRRDNRHTLRAYGEVEIVDDLKATAEVRFNDRSSNLATADYSKNVVSLGLEYDF